MMNQVSRQNAKNSVEKDFYKLKNNSNFGYNCRNNIDNCTFAPISDELDKILYLKKYQSLFDTSMSEFVLCELIEKEIESNFNSSIMKLKLGDEYYDAQ